ncbi:hypothetical protein RFI_37074, partial [Reticulomyxa filosa]
GELLIGNHATDELVRTTTGKIEDIIFLIGKKLKAKILRGGDSILVVKENEDECRKAFESAITNVMIGVPDDFNNTQTRAVVDAAKVAGFKERIGIYVYNKMGWHYVVCGIIASIRPQLKHQLTFQSQAFVHIPSFTDGVDLKLAITREKFEEVLAPLFLKFSDCFIPKVKDIIAGIFPAKKIHYFVLPSQMQEYMQLQEQQLNFKDRYD